MTIYVISIAIKMLYLRYLSTVLAATTTLVASYPVTEKYYEHYFPAGMKTTCDGDHFALTFDDGPYMYTNDLLDKLDEAGIKVSVTNLCLRDSLPLSLT